MKSTGNFILEVPVLLIAFNRPDTTAQVFERIRAAKPKKIYIAIDGAMEANANDNIQVEQVKSIVQNVDWICEANYRFNEENKGAEVTVSSAIDWVFERKNTQLSLKMI